MSRVLSLLVLCLVVAFILPTRANGAQVELVGLFGDRAVLMVDGGAPRTLRVGERSSEGVRLLEVGKDSALVEVDGERSKLVLGQAPVRSAPQTKGSEEFSVIADSRGHFVTQGAINGATVKFLVDTGASMISLGFSDARRAGVNVREGERSVAQTASGPMPVWLHRLDSVRLGGIILYGVDAIVHENDLPFALLGMSFLNRMDMQREGDRLILRKRY